MLLPQINAAEASVVRGARCHAAENLRQACQHFVAETPGLPLIESQIAESAQVLAANPLVSIRGQLQAKRALTIAAAGGHNMLMVGPPGTGKTMLANALPHLLPPLSEEAALQVASVRSVAGLPVSVGDWGRPPFRSPHHGASAVAIVGGGRHLNPGEITLAHRGVLFLDELTEFKRHVLESMREPLEAGVVTISRADYRVTFPADFQLICAMNPCPCGYFGDSQRQCTCTPDRIARYLEKISGPLLDRIDLQVEVGRLDYDQLMGEAPATDQSHWTPAEIAAVRQIQQTRNGCLNARLTVKGMHRVCPLTREGDELMKSIVEKLRLSARACHRIIKLARTIADMEGSPGIELRHLAEAASFRGTILPGAAAAP
jgi:magnesium chelatase family protein